MFIQSQPKCMTPGKKVAWTPAGPNFFKIGCNPKLDLQNILVGSSSASKGEANLYTVKEKPVPEGILICFHTL